MSNEPNIPAYNVFYHDFDGIRIVYDGIVYKQSEIIEIDYNPFYQKLWDKEHPGKPYPWAIPDGKHVYLTTYYGGSGDYDIHQGRMKLEKMLDDLKKSVSPSHPYTTKQAHYNNHPYDVLDDCLYYDEDEEDYGNDTRELIGWENLDDAKLVVVSTYRDSVPVYAIELPEPKNLRPVNKRLAELRIVREFLVDAEYALGENIRPRYLDDKLKDLGFSTQISFHQMCEDIHRMLNMINNAIDIEEHIGRSID